MDKKACSEEMATYFADIDAKIAREYEIATIARKKGYDPEDEVPVPLSADMAERVERLISVLIPQIVNSGVSNRLKELEDVYSSLDWRVALKISSEVANSKFCTFKDQNEAIETGIRVGLAYLTMGTVSSPLEGFLGIKIRKRKDGKEYWAVAFGGPIRSAGGTMAAVTVVIADYLRKEFGYDIYDPTPEEVKRYVTELYDYHERVTNLQYLPSEEEITFLGEHLPVQIDGDPSEIFEVSNYKDLPRIETNNLRNGMCLVFGEGIAQKATKVWSQVQTWGKDLGLDEWMFMGEFVELQKKIKAHAKKTDSGEKPKIMADYTFIKDLVAGRPVFTHPLRVGGFRLRYGRSRNSGFSSYGIHPATMFIVNEYLATGTQMKLERPGKATSISACDCIDGPIVKLHNGSVIEVSDLETAKRVSKDVAEIIFLGDILINYGDFFNRKHSLVPAGYCPEWWVMELEKAIVSQCGVLDFSKASDLTGIAEEKFHNWINNPLSHSLKIEDSLQLADVLRVPLHPMHTHHWKTISVEETKKLRLWLLKGNFFEEDGKIIKFVVLSEEEPKRVLEILGVPHELVRGYVVVTTEAPILKRLLRLPEEISEEECSAAASGLDVVNTLSKIIIRDKSGTFIGARMGRPEKAKERELTGSPQVMFPVGEEGGRLRSFQAALQAGKVTSDYPVMWCDVCQKETIFRCCQVCENRTIQKYFCRQCDSITPDSSCVKHGPCQTYRKYDLNVTHYFSQALKKLKMVVYPDLIKGVRGTSNRSHIPERLEKGILRAKHEIHVNKDGTIRYDMTQLVVTHFTPFEVGVTVERLRELQYLKDIYGNDLVNADQIVELKPQDIILPLLDRPLEGADRVLFRAANFIDECLVSLYGMKPYYNLKTHNDLVGHIVICLAPHTSAAIAARIIGFTKTQGFFAHPLIHAAQRRDCDGDESCVMLLLDALLNFSRKFLSGHRGATQDAPLVLTSRLVPSEVDDMVFDMDTVWKYPLELYEAALEYQNPATIKIEQMKIRLGTPGQYEGMGFTHHISNMNNTVMCSAYKTLPTMEEKMQGQMDLAKRIRAVSTEDVARLIIEKHFLKDTKGNLRKFSMQQFRCVSCNEKFRRPPLLGKCTKCKGKLLFTISEGSVIKYLQPTIDLAKKYSVSEYLRQTINVLQKRVESTFGKDKEKQEGLGKFFGAKVTTPIPEVEIAE